MKALLVVAPVAVLWLASAVLLSSYDEKRPGFSSLEDCRSWAQANGYRVTPGPIMAAFWITDDPDVDLAALAPFKQTPRCVIVVPAETIADQHDAKSSVVWGGVAAWGCPELLVEYGNVLMSRKKSTLPCVAAFRFSPPL